MLRNDVFRRTHLQSMPLDMLAIKRELHGFYFYSYMWLCSCSYGAPSDGFLGRLSYAMSKVWSLTWRRSAII